MKKATDGWCNHPSPAGRGLEQGSMANGVKESKRKSPGMLPSYRGFSVSLFPNSEQRIGVAGAMQIRNAPGTSCAGDDSDAYRTIPAVRGSPASDGNPAGAGMRFGLLGRNGGIVDPMLARVKHSHGCVNEKAPAC